MKINKSTIAKGISLANSAKNPKDLFKKAIEMLQGVNPKVAKTIYDMVLSNKNPKEALTSFAKNGDIKQDDLQLIKTIYGFAKKMGLKINVSDDVWQGAENAFKSTSTQDKFTGF